MNGITVSVAVFVSAVWSFAGRTADSCPSTRMSVSDLPKLEGLDCRLPRRYATLKGNVLTIDIPSADYPETALAVVSVAPELFCGKERFAFAVVASGERIAEPAVPYLGLKSQICWTDAEGEKEYRNARSVTGDFIGRQLYASAEFGSRIARRVELQLGLQSTSGKVSFDLSTLCGGSCASIFMRKNEEKRIWYPPCVSGDIRRRGVMLPENAPSEDEFRTLRKWGATLVRYQMVRRWKKANDNLDLAEYACWLEDKLDVLERTVLPLARQHGMKVAVDLHVPPGGKTASGEMNMFDCREQARAFVDSWKRIAMRFRGNSDVIYGYDLINEPSQQGPAHVDYLRLQEIAAKAVRAIDPDTPIIVEANDKASPSAFGYLSPIDLDNVIYQVHMYQPFRFTHQGVFGDCPPIAYPNGQKGWDREFLRRTLQPIRDFSRRHRAKIYVGEFSVAAWAEGGDRYLRDCISLFEEYEWDWTYHAFREWSGWSVEHEGTGPNDLRPAKGETSRKRELLKGLARTRAKETR